jgi:hypothetical protein
MRRGRKAVPFLSALIALRFLPSFRPVSFPFPSLPSGLWPFLPFTFPFPSLVSTGTNRNEQQATGNETEPRGFAETTWERNGWVGRGGGPSLFCKLTATWGHSVTLHPHFVHSEQRGPPLFPISFIGGQGGGLSFTSSPSFPAVLLSFVKGKKGLSFRSKGEWGAFLIRSGTFHIVLIMAQRAKLNCVRKEVIVRKMSA